MNLLVYKQVFLWVFNLPVQFLLGLCYSKCGNSELIRHTESETSPTLGQLNHSVHLNNTAR